MLKTAVPEFSTGDTVGFEWGIKPMRGFISEIHNYLANLNKVEFWYNINSVKGISYQEHYLQTRRMVLTEKTNGKNINKNI